MLRIQEQLITMQLSFFLNRNKKHLKNVSKGCSITVKAELEAKKSKLEDDIINLGDLTDSNILRAEELTALAEAYACRDNDSVKEIYITGNHDTLTDDHRYSATSILRSTDDLDYIYEFIESE